MTTPLEKAAVEFLEADRKLGAHLKQCGVKHCGPYESTLDCPVGVALFRARSAAYSNLSREAFRAR